ncbi:MAG: septum formation initiator family protein [Gemmatimonadales bacterium]
MNRTRAAGLVILVGGLVFGFAGGEYSTFDWRQLKRDVQAETVAIERLTVAMDSLRAVAVGLERDPAVQEQVARERFGMVRPGELLFRVEPVPNEVP